MAATARALCALGLLLLLAACKVELYSNLSEEEANAMLAILLNNGITSEKVIAKEGVSLEVDEGEVARAVQILRMQGYPREKFASMGDLFKKEGLISSPTEERVRFIYALSQGLAETISQIDGVLAARVHVVLPNNNFADENAKPSSAAVFIRHRNDHNLEQFIPQIKILVTNSIEGLSYDKVSVVLFPVSPPAGGLGGSPFEEAISVRLDPSTALNFWLIVGVLGVLAVGGLGSAGYMAWLMRRNHNGSGNGQPPQQPQPQRTAAEHG